MNRITANQIKKLLADKHGKDVFVSECKDGPTWRGEHLRLDAWVMTRSWSKPLTIGYEIKVSRSDFLRDEKWRDYLGLCNEFYFVCPPGLIDPREVQAEVGLLVTSANGGRLFSKKKAAFRDVQIPESLYRYILMCRAKITREIDYGSSADRWREWLDQKAENRELGYRVSRGIREAFDTQVLAVKTENSRLMRENGNLESVRQTLDELGLKGRADWNLRWDVEKRVKALQDAIPEDLVVALKNARRGIDSALDAAQKAIAEARQGAA